MPLVPMKQILDEALKKKYGVGGYNINNMEQIMGVMKAAATTKSPVILQISRGALEYTNGYYIKHLVHAAVEENPKIPIAMHLDHGDKLATVKKVIDMGFTSVMIDASKYDFKKNVRITREVVKYAHKHGVSVEGEIGTLGGIEEDIVGEVHVTEPEQAVSFAEKTGVDAMAIAVGTSHGPYKFKGTPHLALKRVSEIRELLPKLPLVMHGSSSVPPNLRNKINRYGGKMPKAHGVPLNIIGHAIKRGITKINVDTDSRMAMTEKIREIFKKKPEIFDPRHYLGPARDQITNEITRHMKAFSTTGHAGDYKPTTLAVMKARYNRKK